MVRPTFAAIEQADEIVVVAGNHRRNAERSSADIRADGREPRAGEIPANDGIADGQELHDRIVVAQATSIRDPTHAGQAVGCAISASAAKPSKSWRAFVPADGAMKYAVASGVGTAGDNIDCATESWAAVSARATNCGVHTPDEGISTQASSAADRDIPVERAVNNTESAGVVFNLNSAAIRLTTEPTAAAVVALAAHSAAAEIVYKCATDQEAIAVTGKSAAGRGATIAARGGIRQG